MLFFNLLMRLELFDSDHRELYFHFAIIRAARPRVKRHLACFGSRGVFAICAGVTGPNVDRAPGTS